MNEKIRYTWQELNTEKELEDEMVKISKANPTKVITLYSRFGKVDILLYNSQPRTDTPDTTQTFKHMGGFLKNGKVIRPTKAWFTRYNFRPVSR